MWDSLAPILSPRPLTGESNPAGSTATRRDLGLDLLDRLWATSALGEDETLALGVEAQHATRSRRP